MRLTTVCIIVPCQIKCASIYEFLESSSKKDTIQGLHKNVLNPTKGLLQINSLLIVFLNERLIRYPQSGCGPSNQVLVSASQGTHPTILGQLDKMALSHSLWSSDWSMRLPSRPLIGQEETIEPIVTLTITLLNNCMVSKIWGGGGEICFILSEIRSVC